MINQQRVNVSFPIHKRCTHGGYNEVATHAEYLDVTLLGRRLTEPIRAHFKRLRLPLAVLDPLRLEELRPKWG